MANTTTTSVAGFLPNYYDKVFLEQLSPGPKMMSLVMKKPLPQNNGKVAYFPRMLNESLTVSAATLTEGTAVTPQLLDDAQISATVRGYGKANGIADLTKLTAINSMVEEAVKSLATQANNIIDLLLINEAYGTSAEPHGTGFSCVAWDTALDSEVNAGASIANINATTHSMKAETVRFAVSKLLSRNVKPLEDGFFALVVHSNTAYKLLADSEWQTAYQYTDPENLRKGVVGTYGGAKIIIDNNIRTSANGSAGATVYFSIMLGHGALGATELDGGIKSYYVGGGAEKSDPIDQFITVGWKANFAASRLNLSCGLIVFTADGS